MNKNGSAYWVPTFHYSGNHLKSYLILSSTLNARDTTVSSSKNDMSKMAIFQPLLHFMILKKPTGNQHVL